MNDIVVLTPMQYFDKAVGALRDIGLMPAKLEPAPIKWLIPLTQVALDVVCREVGRVRSPGRTPDG